jgi:hypothetical protein
LDIEEQDVRPQLVDECQGAQAIFRSPHALDVGVHAEEPLQPGSSGFFVVY